MGLKYVQMKRVGDTPAFVSKNPIFPDLYAGDVIVAKIPPISYWYKPWTWFRRSELKPLGVVCPAGHVHALPVDVRLSFSFEDSSEDVKNYLH